TNAVVLLAVGGFLTFSGPGLSPPLRATLGTTAEGKEEADAILDELGREAFRWFQENRNPRTGLVRDRAPNRRGRGKTTPMASIASVGYFLSLLPEAVRTRQIERGEAVEQAERALRFASEQMETHDGLFYHFIDWETGRRWDKSEVSLLDSAI